MNVWKSSEEMNALLAELVRCPTENRPPYGYEAAGQAVLCKAYEDIGLETHRVCPSDLKEYPDHPAFLPRVFDDRENVVGIWKGSGEGKSLLLTGHMDVAPKEPMPWVITQPYEPLLKDGRMYGRGTADMKAGLVCAWEAVRRLKAQGFVPKGDIILESVVDEEYAGANGTIAGRLSGYNADFGIVLEPSGLNICPACVGGLVIKLSVQGIAGMPYTGEEIGNPAFDIAELIQLVKQFSEKRMGEAVAPQLWEGTVQGAQVVITKVKAGEVGEEGQLSSPIDAWMEIVMQSYPGEEEDELIGALRDFMNANYHDPAGLTITRLYRYCRPAATDANETGIQTLAECAAPYTNLSKVCGAMFSCDMFALTELGKIPSVIFGPVGGRLHAPDEWVDLESMEICTRSLMDFIIKWCG
ncbi:MAG: M20/M25/M40 family metallo-hydrolase [Clostridia bacterium]|nr:M20/M25/M40 family metallo-hydrolase [Clostridia bacterium]